VTYIEGVRTYTILRCDGVIGVGNGLETVEAEAGVDLAVYWNYITVSLKRPSTNQDGERGTTGKVERRANKSVMWTQNGLGVHLEAHSP